MNQLTGFLYADPSFLEGMGRVLDFSGTFSEFNSCVTGEQADFYAILSDWKAVGLDISSAMERFEAQLQQ